MAKQELILGGGCFWCTEAVFEIIKGVSAVESGYANGEIPNPTYRDICTGESGYAEVIKISFDDEIISTERLLEMFFASHNPTTLNQQGADRGTQYRSTILYSDEVTKELAQTIKEKSQKNYSDSIVTIIEPLKNYYEAEDYHQDYYRQNSTQGYCMAVIPPKIEKVKSLFGENVVD
ncbi:MAG: peptide-methionine (S)-S-oxide reductase MsrA [Sulfurovum sp.]